MANNANARHGRCSKMHFATRLLHADAGEPLALRSTTPPIYQTSAYEFEDADRHAKVAGGSSPGYVYTRLGNPTVAAFERRMTALEGGVASVATASGMAAIFNAIMNVVRSGDQIIAGSCLYGGTMGLFDELADFGVDVVYVPQVTPAALEGALTDRTRLIYAETISNPKLEVVDIAAAAEFAHAHGCVLVVDNTVATPYLCRPLDLGADIVVESSSKYINGHSNGISGVITDSGRECWNIERFPGFAKFKKFGPMALTARMRNGLFRDSGACLSPQNAFLNCLGLETLEVRMERACGNALALATALRESGQVDEVRYPGLPDDPSYGLAERQFGGRGFGAMVTIRVGSRERAFQVIDHLTIPLRVSNIGDTKTLVAHPASTIFHDNTPAEQEGAGVYPDSIRISVGIEDKRDLVDDFLQALEACPRRGAQSPQPARPERMP